MDVSADSTPLPGVPRSSSLQVMAMVVVAVVVAVLSTCAEARNMPCGALVVLPPSSPPSLHTGGFSAACFERKAVTFDTCKRLLLSRQQDGCSALSYTHYSCSLHNRQLSSWQPIPTPVGSDSNFNKSVIQMLLLSASMDSCTFARGTPDRKERLQSDYSSQDDDILPACLQDPLLAPLPESQTQPPTSGSNRGRSELSTGIRNWLALPRLGIVMAVTSDWMHTFQLEISSLVDNWKCYARTHNYNFHLHITQPTSVVEKFYHTRHKDVIDAHLHKYRFLLVLDSDNLVMNMSRSLDHIVNATPLDGSHPYANVDVFLHMREGGEVTASTYFIRNSAFSRCFVQYWRNLAPSDSELQQSNNKWVETPNNDNGDLVAALMNIIHPSIALQCSAALRSHTNNTNRHKIYDNKILLCFRLFRGALVNITQYVPQIKVFFIREDFFRMHSGHTITKENMLLRKDASCHRHDVIVHGWKDLGARYWPLQRHSSIGHNRYPSCDVDVFRRGGGGNALCRWLHGGEELEIVKKHCYWRSPLCTGGSTIITDMGAEELKNTTGAEDEVRSADSINRPVEVLGGSDRGMSRNNTGGNVCVRDEDRGGSCWDRERINLMRWSLCLHHQVCDPYLSISLIRTKYLPMYQLPNPF